VSVMALSCLSRPTAISVGAGASSAPWRSDRDSRPARTTRLVAPRVSLHSGPRCARVFPPVASNPVKRPLSVPTTYLTGGSLWRISSNTSSVGMPRSKVCSLDVPFEQINSEQPVKRIYNWASPIDSSEPPDSTVNLASGQTQTFGVQLPQPLNHSLDVTWKVNGNTAGTSEQFTFSASTVGSHTPWRSLSAIRPCW